MHFYTVVIRMHINAYPAVSLSSDDAWLERRFALPFVPFVGLTIDHDAWSATLEEVRWDNSQQHFKCYVKSDRTLYNADLNRANPATPSLACIVADYLKQGWEREPQRQRKG